MAYTGFNPLRLHQVITGQIKAAVVAIWNPGTSASTVTTAANKQKTVKG